MWELSQFLKGILPAHHNFQGGDTFILLQIDLYKEGDETHVSLEENHLC
jgi:hypothetical protein